MCERMFRLHIMSLVTMVLWVLSPKKPLLHDLWVYIHDTKGESMVHSTQRYQHSLFI